MNAGSDCIVLAYEVWHPHLHLHDWSSSLSAEGSGLYGYDVLWTIWCSLVGASRTLTTLRWKNTLWNEYFVLRIIVEEEKVFCFVNSHTCHCICAHKHTFCFSTRGIFKNKHVCDDYPTFGFYCSWPYQEPSSPWVPYQAMDPLQNYCKLHFCLDNKQEVLDT